MKSNNWYIIHRKINNWIDWLLKAVVFGRREVWYNLIYYSPYLNFSRFFNLPSIFFNLVSHYQKVIGSVAMSIRCVVIDCVITTAFHNLCGERDQTKHLAFYPKCAKLYCHFASMLLILCWRMQDHLSKNQQGYLE